MCKKKLLLIFIILFLISTLFSESNRKKIIVTKKMLEDFVSISNDEAVFDENDLMKLYDPDDQLICYYGTFKHQSMELYNRKIFNTDKELLVTCVYSGSSSLATEYFIQFKNKDEKIGKIKVMKSAGFGSMNYKFDINYYDPDYDVNFFAEPGFGGIEYETILYKGNDIVMYWKRQSNVLSGKASSVLYVQKDFMKNNRMDVAYWAILFFMIY